MEEVDIDALANALHGQFQYACYQDCQDAVSIALTDAWKAFDSFDPERASFESWIFGIAKLRLRRQQRSNMEIECLPLAPGQHFHTHAPVECESGYDSTREAAVRKGIESLSPRQRQIIELDLADPRERAPSAEVAEVLGISAESVRVHRSRAKSRLKKNLSHLMTSLPTTASVNS
mgnify:CR=1 FL=1